MYSAVRYRSVKHFTIFEEYTTREASAQLQAGTAAAK